MTRDDATVSDCVCGACTPCRAGGLMTPRAAAAFRVRRALGCLHQFFAVLAAPIARSKYERWAHLTNRAIATYDLELACDSHELALEWAERAAALAGPLMCPICEHPIEAVVAVATVLDAQCANCGWFVSARTR